MSATARSAAVHDDVAAPSTSAPKQSADKRTHHLRPLPSPRPRAARGPFVAFIALILGVGLLGLLGLNTVLAQGAFTAYDLRHSTAVLADQEQALLQEVATKESPKHLQREANRLGMVPSVNPVFLRLSDGTVLGVPKKAKKPPAPVVKKPSATTTPTTTKPTATKPAATKPAATKPTATKPTATKPATTAGQGSTQ